MWFLLFTGETIDRVMWTGDFGFGGKYWWATGTTFGCWLDDAIMPSRLLKDLFVERTGAAFTDATGGEIIGWEITGGTSIGFVLKGIGDDWLFRSWVNAGTSSSTMFVEGKRELVVDDEEDNWDIWRLILFNDNNGGWEFVGGDLWFDWDSSSI